MDLPKNITQIGEADAKCKIYVEDYVVSFLKQLNPLARDKTMAAALYGRRKTEEDKTYLFVYGAGKLDFIQKETRHLSSAQRQEIERIRQQYFGDYEFLGYRILDGDMVDGFHICEQDICRFVSGYAQFYENNEAMLTYMLESRQVEAAPESVDNERYDMVRDRQEKRRARFAEHKKELSKEQTSQKKITGVQTRGIQAAAASVFVILCALGLTLNSSMLQEQGSGWDKLKAEFMEKKLPDSVQVSGQEVQIETLNADDQLTEAIRAENKRENDDDVTNAGKNNMTGGSQTASEEAQETTAAAIPGEAADQKAPQTDERAEALETDGVIAGPTDSETDDQTQSAVNADAVQVGDESPAELQTDEIPATESGEAVKPTETGAGDEEPQALREYTVCQGDTLTGISIRVYGNGAQVDRICSVNRISNPDEIQIGQKILLP